MELPQNHHLGGVRGRKPVKEPEMKWLLRKTKPGECDAMEPMGRGRRGKNRQRSRMLLSCQENQSQV